MESSILVFGEVLFDHFPDGEMVLGGAPFNVAWHLQGFGLVPQFVSRIGEDNAGNKVIAAMSSWGMETKAVQRDSLHPTGTVEVSIQDQQPSFEILPDQAYDFIENEPITRAPEVLYYGTLAARGQVSGNTLTRLIQSTDGIRFVDINLRSPWWNSAAVKQALHHAQYAKLNDAELITLCGPAVSDEALIANAQTFRKAYDLELLILTFGADGACFIAEDNVLQMAANPVTDLVDTVGAGDAFSAVVLLGLMKSWTHAVTLQRALEFASLICGQRGATACNRELYSNCMNRWQP